MSKYHIQAFESSIKKKPAKASFFFLFSKNVINAVYSKV